MQEEDSRDKQRVLGSRVVMPSIWHEHFFVGDGLTDSRALAHIIPVMILLDSRCIKGHKSVMRPFYSLQNEPDAGIACSPTACIEGFGAIDHNPTGNFASYNMPACPGFGIGGNEAGVLF